MGCDCMLPPYSVRCREPDGWRFHDHVAQMTDMLDLHLNAIPSFINSGGLRFYPRHRASR